MRTSIKIGLCLLSAFLIVKSDWFNGLLAWFCLVPIAIVILQEKPSVSARYGSLTGLCVGMLLFWGVIPYGMRYYGLLMLYCSLNGALLSRTFTYLHCRINGYLKVFIPPLVWISFEYLRTQFAISFPLSLGSSQSNWPELIQITSVFGVYGLSFMVVLGNYTIFRLLRWPRRRETYILLAFFIALLISLFKWGEARMERTLVKGPMRVAVLQGGIPMWAYHKGLYDTEYTEYITNRYLQLAKEAGETKPDLIIWPEIPVNRPLDETNYGSQISEIARNSGSHMLLGAPEQSEGKYYNTVFLISRQGEVLDKYRKSRPVPFVEEYHPGGKPQTIMTPLGKFGAAICFESIYPSILRNLTKSGAECLFILTNDAGFGNPSIPYLHAREAIFRAVENRRWTVRAAQSGISMLVDPFGRVIEKTELSEKTIFTGLIETSDALTFYTRFGDLFAISCLSTTLLCLVYTWFKK